MWLETIIKPIVDDNEVIKLICTSRNITDQRIAQEKLKKKDQLLHAVSEATHSLLVNTDLNQAITESIQYPGQQGDGRPGLCFPESVRFRKQNLVHRSDQ